MLSSSASTVTFPSATFAHQPLKAIYITALFLGLILRQPIWIIKHYLRLQPYPSSWNLLQGVGVQSLRYLSRIIPDCDFRFNLSSRTELPSIGGKQSRSIWIPALADTDREKWLIKGSIADDGQVDSVRCPAIVFGNDAKGTGDLQVGAEENVLLFFHGGAFLIGGALESDEIPINILRRASSSVQHAVSVDYTKVHDAPFPAHLVDAVSAYAYLTSHLSISPSRIVIGGDSAGANVALALVRYLRDDVKVREIPRALLLLSPSCDLSSDLDESMDSTAEIELRSRQDYLNRGIYKQYMIKRLLRHHPRSLLSSPYLSPASSLVEPTEDLFKSFPVTLITCGAVETFRHSIEELARRMTMSGVDLTFHLEPDAVHDYEIIPFWSKESKDRTFELISSWIQKQLSQN